MKNKGYICQNSARIKHPTDSTLNSSHENINAQTPVGNLLGLSLLFRFTIELRRIGICVFESNKAILQVKQEHKKNV